MGFTIDMSGEKQLEFSQINICEGQTDDSRLRQDAQGTVLYKIIENMRHTKSHWHNYPTVIRASQLFLSRRHGITDTSRGSGMLIEVLDERVFCS